MAVFTREEMSVIEDMTSSYRDKKIVCSIMEKIRSIQKATPRYGAKSNLGYLFETEDWEGYPIATYYRDEKNLFVHKENLLDTIERCAPAEDITIFENYDIEINSK